MTEPRSFRAFIEKRYYDILWDSLFDFISENSGKNEINSYRVSCPNETELLEVNIQRVDVFDSTEDEVQFDVITETEITISEMHHRRDKEKDEKMQWFSISCSAIVIDEGLHDFAKNRITINDRRSENKINTHLCFMSHKTVADVLVESGRLQDFLNNP